MLLVILTVLFTASQANAQGWALNAPYYADQPYEPVLVYSGTGGPGGPGWRAVFGSQMGATLGAAGGSLVNDRWGNVEPAAVIGGTAVGAIAGVFAGDALDRADARAKARAAEVPRETCYWWRDSTGKRDYACTGSQTQQVPQPVYEPSQGALPPQLSGIILEGWSVGPYQSWRVN